MMMRVAGDVIARPAQRRQRAHIRLMRRTLNTRRPFLLEGNRRYVRPSQAAAIGAAISAAFAGESRQDVLALAQHHDLSAKLAQCSRWRRRCVRSDDHAQA
jgi:hypothetical protein